MKTPPFLLLSGLLLTFSSFLFGQTTPGINAGQIKGVVVGENDEPLLGADVAVRSDIDDRLVKGTVTDEAGFFLVADLPPTKYKIYVHYLGYQTDTLTLTIEDNVDVGRLVLEPEAAQLDGVVVTARLPTIQRKPDRTILNISNSIYASGENSYNLLNVVPEVQVDGLGNIRFRGQNGAIVYIDDRRIRMTGQQLMIFLRSIPSETIEKIEILSVPGAQYEAEGTSAIINIVTKKDYRYGVRGNVYGNYDQHRYPGAGGGITLTYAKDKFVFQGSYDYSLFNFFNDINLRQAYQSETPPIEFDQSDNYRETYHSHAVNLGVDFKLSDKDKIGARYLLSQVNWDMRYRALTDILANGNLDSLFTTRTFQDESLTDQTIRTFYNRELSSGKLSIGYDYISYDNPSLAFYESTFLDENGNQFRNSDSSFINNMIDVDIHVGNVDYLTNVSDRWELKAGLKVSDIITNNIIQYFVGELPEVGEESDPRSNNFRYDENIYSAYTSAGYQGERWSFNAGLRLERTIYQGTSFTDGTSFLRKRLDWFPSFYLQHRIDDEHLLNLSVGRRILRPAYEKLNPFIDYRNPYSFDTGNPSLLPAFATSYELNYLLRGTYNFSAGYKRTSDLIGDVYLREGDRTVISTYENLSDQDYYFVSASIPIQVSDRYRINNYLNGYHDRITVNEGFNQGSYDQSTFFFYSGHSLTLTDDFSVELSGYFQSATLYGLYRNKPMGAVNFTARKSFLPKKNLNVSINFFDIFATQRSRIFADFGGVVRESDSFFTSRMAKISISYQFTSGKKETALDESDAPSDSEKNRIN